MARVTSLPTDAIREVLYQKFHGPRPIVEARRQFQALLDALAEQVEPIKKIVLEPSTDSPPKSVEGA